jgi:hypothetical protein
MLEGTSEMRTCLACVLFLASSGMAIAAEQKSLPAYFQESFEAVAAEPLVAYKPADETGAIPGVGADVPTPPARPDPSAAFTVKVPENVRIADPTSFVVGNDRYVLATLEGLDVQTQCVREASGRCMVRPMRFLKNAIAGRTLTCQRAADGSEKVTCEK